MKRKDEDEGASAVEYGLLVAAIAAVVVGVVFGLGTIVRGAFSSTCEAMRAGPVASPAAPGEAGCDGNVVPVPQPTDAAIP